MLTVSRIRGITRRPRAHMPLCFYVVDGDACQNGGASDSEVVLWGPALTFRGINTEY
jgi:hypothetical protein